MGGRDIFHIAWREPSSAPAKHRQSVQHPTSILLSAGIQLAPHTYINTSSRGATVTQWPLFFSFQWRWLLSSDKAPSSLCCPLSSPLWWRDGQHIIAPLRVTVGSDLASDSSITPGNVGGFCLQSFRFISHRDSHIEKACLYGNLWNNVSVGPHGCMDRPKHQEGSADSWRIRATNTAT